MTKLNWGKRYWQFNSMHMLKLLKTFHWYLDDILNRSWQRNLEKSSKSLVKIWKKFLQTYIDLHIVGSKSSTVTCGLFIHTRTIATTIYLENWSRKKGGDFFCFQYEKIQIQNMQQIYEWIKRRLFLQNIRDEAIVKCTNYNLGVGSQRKCQQAIES